MFLPANKLAEIDRKKEIVRLVTSKPIAHHTYTTKKNVVVSRLSIKAGKYNMYAEHRCDQTRPEYDQVHYTLRANYKDNIIYATHSNVDKFAQRIYNKMYKLLVKNNKKAR